MAFKRILIKTLSEAVVEVRKALILQGFSAFLFYSHSANSDIWERILGDFTGKTFANMLMLYLLFGATRFLSIKIVSQKRRKSNLFRPYTAPKTPLILRGVSVEMGLKSRPVSTTAWERKRSQAIGDWFPPRRKSIPPWDAIRPLTTPTGFAMVQNVEVIDVANRFYF